MKLDSTGATWVQGNIFAGGRHLATLGGNTNFSHSDWLGTERFLTTYAGAVCGSIASLPFGDGQTTTSPPYDGCYHPSPLHFTGKQRDPESGLDNFGARYDASSMGRFMSPDPKQIGAHMFDPQTLNRYAYTRNNPLAYVDPDGRDLEKAWTAFKTFVKSLSVKATVGLGYEAHAELGKIGEAKVGVAAKVSLETSIDSFKLSRSASAGAEAGAKGAKVGESWSVEQTVMTITNGTITGAEKPEVTRTDSFGLFGGSVESSKDKVGIGLELPAAELPVVGGIDLETNQEGLTAFKDAGRELKDSLTNPGPPPTPPPPPPPTCVPDANKKC
jgi:RHS repeat-associated protein